VSEDKATVHPLPGPPDVRPDGDPKYRSATCVGPTLSDSDLTQLREVYRFTPELDDLALLHSLASSNTRLKILALLANCKEVCVCDLASILEVAVPTVSQHLSKLKGAGLVVYRRDAQTLYYRLTDHPFVQRILGPLLESVSDE